MNDDMLSGANGSVRRFIGGIADRSIAGAGPTQNAGSLTAGGIAHDFTAAQGAAYGSIASRNDPNRFGSAASRLLPGVFGPDGALNPQYQQQQAGAAQASEQRRQVGVQNALQQNQAVYNANALQPLITSLLSSTQRQPIGSRINSPSSPFPSRLSDDDSGDLEQSR